MRLGDEVQAHATRPVALLTPSHPPCRPPTLECPSMCPRTRVECLTYAAKHSAARNRVPRYDDMNLITAHVGD